MQIITTIFNRKGHMIAQLFTYKYFKILQV